MPTLAVRADWRAYMDTGNGTPKYDLIGLGFTSFTESKNPMEYSRRYVHERTERTDVTGYSTSIDYEMDMYVDDPVCEQIKIVHDEELIGSAAQRSVVLVNLFEKGVTSGSFVAYQRNFAVIPDSKGDGTDALIYSGSLRAVGDSIKGEYDPILNLFTPDDED